MRWYGPSPKCHSYQCLCLPNWAARASCLMPHSPCPICCRSATSFFATLLMYDPSSQVTRIWTRDFAKESLAFATPSSFWPSVSTLSSAETICLFFCSASITSFFVSLHWFPGYSHIQHKLLVLIFKVPVALHFFSFISHHASLHDLQSSSVTTLYCSKISCSLNRLHSFPLVVPYTSNMSAVLPRSLP